MAAYSFTSATNVWAISISGGSLSLPILLCNYDLIPHRVRWESPSGIIGDQAIIQDVQGNIVYQEIINESPFSFVEQRPTLNEKWMGYQAIGYQIPNAPAGPNSGITVTKLDSGVILIYL